MRACVRACECMSMCVCVESDRRMCIKMCPCSDLFHFMSRQSDAHRKTFNAMQSKTQRNDNSLILASAFFFFGTNKMRTSREKKTAYIDNAISHFTTKMVSQRYVARTSDDDFCCTFAVLSLSTLQLITFVLYSSLSC